VHHPRARDGLPQSGIEHIREVAIGASLQVLAVRARRGGETPGGFAIFTMKMPEKSTLKSIT
jgi:hypothetical protein